MYGLYGTQQQNKFIVVITSERTISCCLFFSKHARTLFYNMPSIYRKPSYLIFKRKKKKKRNTLTWLGTKNKTDLSNLRFYSNITNKIPEKKCLDFWVHRNSWNIRNWRKNIYYFSRCAKVINIYSLFDDVNKLQALEYWYYTYLCDIDYILVKYFNRMKCVSKKYKATKRRVLYYIILLILI